jgi:arylsulfatase A-like enzyme
LADQGAFSFWAYTTPVAITLPSHTSMLTGVTVERHGITGNDDNAAATQKIKVPTLFDLAHKAGISTGMSAGKSKFTIFSESGSVDHSWVKAATADNVAGQAVNILRQHQPRLMFVHFADVDGVGHSKGWGSRDQIAAIERVDLALGMVIDELKRQELFDKTTILITADHGGSGKTHGKDDDRSRFIPWILVGPGVLKNVDLGQFRELKINTYDTFATACRVLDLPTPEGIDGKAIVQAFKATDLMNSPAPATQPANPK